MVLFFGLFFILYFTYPLPSHGLFSIQETLTILCNQFPLVSTANNSDLKCARLRIDDNVPTSAFNFNGPTQICLFIIIDLPLSNISPVDITIDFNSLSSTLLSINEIRLSLLVTNSNFTINNQTTTEYTPYEIPIFRWQNFTENNYELIDLLQFQSQEYVNDNSLCKWNLDLWNRIFNESISNNVSYAYFLKTSNPQLTFTFVDTKNISSVPPPYLNILYCIPYKLGATEIILLVCAGVLLLVVAIIVAISHYFKGGDDNRTRHFERYYHHHHHHHPHHNQQTEDQSIRNNSKMIRQRSSASMSTAQQEYQDT